MPTLGEFTKTVEADGFSRAEIRDHVLKTSGFDIAKFPDGADYDEVEKAAKGFVENAESAQSLFARQSVPPGTVEAAPIMGRTTDVRMQPPAAPPPADEFGYQQALDQPTTLDEGLYIPPPTEVLPVDVPTDVIPSPMRGTSQPSPHPALEWQPPVWDPERTPEQQAEVDTEDEAGDILGAFDDKSPGSYIEAAGRVALSAVNFPALIVEASQGFESHERILESIPDIAEATPDAVYKYARAVAATTGLPSLVAWGFGEGKDPLELLNEVAFDLAEPAVDLATSPAVIAGGIQGVGDAVLREIGILNQHEESYEASQNALEYELTKRLPRNIVLEVGHDIKDLAEGMATLMFDVVNGSGSQEEIDARDSSSILGYAVARTDRLANLGRGIGRDLFIFLGTLAKDPLEVARRRPVTTAFQVASIGRGIKSKLSVADQAKLQKLMVQAETIRAKVNQGLRKSGLPKNLSDSANVVAPQIASDISNLQRAMLDDPQGPMSKTEFFGGHIERPPGGKQPTGLSPPGGAEPRPTLPARPIPKGVIVTLENAHEYGVPRGLYGVAPTNIAHSPFAFAKQLWVDIVTDAMKKGEFYDQLARGDYGKITPRWQNAVAKASGIEELLGVEEARKAMARVDPMRPNSLVKGYQALKKKVGKTRKMASRHEAFFPKTVKKGSTPTRRGPGVKESIEDRNARRSYIDQLREAQRKAAEDPRSIIRTAEEAIADAESDIVSAREAIANAGDDAAARTAARNRLREAMGARETAEKVRLGADTEAAAIRAASEARVEGSVTRLREVTGQAAADASADRLGGLADEAVTGVKDPLAQNVPLLVKGDEGLVRLAGEKRASPKLVAEAARFERPVKSSFMEEAEANLIEAERAHAEALASGDEAAIRVASDAASEANRLLVEAEANPRPRIVDRRAASAESTVEAGKKVAPAVGRQMDRAMGTQEGAAVLDADLDAAFGPESRSPAAPDVPGSVTKARAENLADAAEAGIESYKHVPDGGGSAAINHTLQRRAMQARIDSRNNIIRRILHENDNRIQQIGPEQIGEAPVHTKVSFYRQFQEGDLFGGSRAASVDHYTDLPKKLARRWGLKKGDKWRVHKDVLDNIKWQDTEQAWNTSQHAAARAFRWLKATATARQPLTHAGNFMSNVMLESVLSGEHPGTLMAKMLKNSFESYEVPNLSGRLVKPQAGSVKLGAKAVAETFTTPEGKTVTLTPSMLDGLKSKMGFSEAVKQFSSLRNVRKWTAINQSGMLTQDILRELGRYEEAGIIPKEKMDDLLKKFKQKPRGKASRLFARAGRPLSPLYKGLEKGYAAGDMMFKKHRASQAWEANMGHFESLGKGEWLRVQETRTTDVKVTRGHPTEGGDGFYTQRYVDNVATGAIRRASLNDIDHLMGRAAKFVADRAYLDYSRSPRTNQYMRASNWTAVASPFTTWAFRTFDSVTGKGLVGEAFNPFGNIKTNSKKVASSILAREAEFMSRRLFLTNTWGTLLDEKRRDLREAAGFRGENATVLFRNSTHPNSIELMNITRMNPWSVTLGVTDAIGLAISGEADVDDVGLAVWKAMGGGRGNPLYDTVRELSDQAIDGDRWRTALKRNAGLITGPFRHALDWAVGHLDDTSPMSTRIQKIERSGDPKTMLFRPGESVKINEPLPGLDPYAKFNLDLFARGMLGLVYDTLNVDSLHKMWSKRQAIAARVSNVFDAKSNGWLKRHRARVTQLRSEGKDDDADKIELDIGEAEDRLLSAKYYLEDLSYRMSQALHDTAETLEVPGAKRYNKSDPRPNPEDY